MRSFLDTVFLAILPVCLVAGCERLVLSVNPIGTSQDWLMEPNLVGTWVHADQVWDFSTAGAEGYSLRIVQGLRQAVFDAHLTKVSGHLLLDLEPDTLPEDAPLTLAMHLVRGHSFWLVEMAGPTLRVSRLRHEQARELLARDPNAPAFLLFGDQLVLTDQPSRLRSFISSHLDTNDLWAEDFAFRKVGRFKAKDLLVRDQALEGRWAGEGLEMWIRREGDRSYRICVIPTSGDGINCWAYLLEIDRIKAMAVYLDESDLDPNGMANTPDMALLVEGIGQELLLRPLDLEDLYRLIEGQGPQGRQQPSLVLRRNPD